MNKGLLVLGLACVAASARSQIASAYSFQVIPAVSQVGIPYYAKGVSADGSYVVGTMQSPAGAQAYRWSAAGGLQGLGDLTGGNFLSEANAVSADGLVVVGYSNSGNGDEAFRWTSN